MKLTRPTTPAPSLTRPSPQLRVAALFTALAGIATLVTAGLAPAPVGLLAAGLVAAAGGASVRLVSETARKNRRLVAAVVLGAAAAGALASTSGGISDDTAPALGTLLCAAAVAHAFVLDTVRDLRVNVTVSLSMLLLAAGLAPGLAIALPVVLTWCGALAALVLAAGESQGETLAVAATTGGPAPAGALSTSRVTPVATAVAVALLVGLALALVLPAPPGVSARSSFGTGEDKSRTPFGTANRSASAYLGDGPLSLDSRGRLSATQIAVVTGKGGALWRASVLETYDGHSWWPHVEGADTVLGDGATSATVPRDRLSPPQASTATQRDGVGWLAPVAPVVLSPGLPSSVDLRSAGRIMQRTDGRLTLATASVTPTYTVSSSVVPRVATVTGPEMGPDADAAVWRALPASLPARVTALARSVTAGTTDRASATRAVEAYLRTHATYDLDSEVAPPGSDSVDHFLFTSKSGFCEHFASAEVVMLRSIGIPSRLASGFLAGAPDTNGRTVLLSSDAHAWAEVWIPGTGWVSSDPTAGAPLAGHNGTGLVGALQRMLDAATNSTTSKIVLAAVLIVLAAIALVAPRLRRRRRDVTAGRAAPSAPLFAAFRRYEDALDHSGRPRAPAESIRALTRRAEATDDVVGALLTVERASYAGSAPTRDEARTAAEAIDRASARLLADADA